MTISLNCKYCNVQFYVRNYRKDIAKYCSRSCQAKDLLVTHTKNCLACNESFSFIVSRLNKAKYCSRKCYYKSQVTKGTVEKNCIVCGEKYLTSPSKAVKRKYCSTKCINRGILGQWKPGFGFVRNYMKLRGMLTKCERCNYNSHIEILGIHHKDRNRKNNEFSNLEVLCPNCHSLEHMRHTPHGFKE